MCTSTGQSSEVLTCNSSMIRREGQISEANNVQSCTMEVRRYNELASSDDSGGSGDG